MRSVLLTRIAIAFALWPSAGSLVAVRGDRAIDRRVVDTVVAGDASSETAHGFAASDDVTARAGGHAYRQTRGWMHYSLAIFEDTDVTVACTFIGVDASARRYDVVVEDSVVATRVLDIARDSVVDVSLSVPFALTKGKTRVIVVLRARDGMSPALRRIRTLQDHNELE